MAGIIINGDGDARRVCRFMGKINEYRKFGMEPVNFECLLAVHVEMLSRQLNIGAWCSREGSGLGI